MPAWKYFRLTELTTVSAAQSQDIRAAVDVGGYHTLVVMCRAAILATSGTLTLQHAATLDEASFVDVASGSFDLSATANTLATFTALLRFVRWRVTTLSGTSQFLIDVVAKEH